MSDILREILDAKARDVAERKRRRPLSVVEAVATDAGPALDFAGSLRAHPPSIIAECKARSPSAGIIAEPYDPEAMARAYSRGGAAAVSVLTDGPYFGGALEHVGLVREVVSIPILLKDFVIDAYQIVEARAWGADSFLLLAGTLDVNVLQLFIEIGREWGMEPLVESHTDDDLRIALATDCQILGINNRNLTTMRTDLAHATDRLRLAADGRRLLVCESGVRSPGDVAHLSRAGYQAFLVGEALMRSPDPATAVAELAAAAPDSER